MIERRADIFTAGLLFLLRRADEPQWRNSCRRLQPLSVWVFFGWREATIENTSAFACYIPSH